MIYFGASTCLGGRPRSKGLNARHAPFAAEARRLPEGFQMKRLRQWLEGLASSSL